MQSGNLYVVAVPIGQPTDISQRALEVLGQVSAVVAEDTRVTQPMLRAHGLRPALVSMHDHNEAERVPELIARMRDGEDLALVSDAGTPLISDPGYRLIRAAHEAGIRVSPLPGACAAVAALSVAGLATDRFFFEGFLPARQAARRARLAELADMAATLVFYEAPHRVAATLSDLVDVLGGDREATLARELTKTYETVRKGRLAALRDWVAADLDQQRGEIVLVVSGAAAPVATDARLLSADEVLARLVRVLPLRQAAAITADLFGLKRNALYDLAMTLRDAEEA